MIGLLAMFPNLRRTGMSCVRTSAGSVRLLGPGTGKNSAA
jgi:hypothetical protein